MVIFGTILAADNIKIEGESIYLKRIGELSILNNLSHEMDKSDVKEWAIVLGHDHDYHRRDCENVPVRCVIDNQWDKGFANQAVEGLKEMPPLADGFIILPGNLPFFSSEIMNIMVDALINEKGFIITLKYRDTIFPYPLFHRKYLGEIMDRLISGSFFDVMLDNPSDVFEIELKSSEPLMQIFDAGQYSQARKIFNDRYDAEFQSNPQSRIPQ